MDLTENRLVERLIVFGSRANDDYETYSDLDLAVDSPLLTKKEWLDLKEFAYYDVRTLLQISLVHFNTNPERLQKQILKTGKIIYVK
jgi:predicted nucleotidyltransferase